MKIIKNIYKCICILSLIVIVMCFGKSNIFTISKASNSNLNKNLDLNAMAKVIDNFRKNDFSIPIDTYNGLLTGYIANCPLCSGKLGCTGQNVLDGTTYYTDLQYGQVRIVASSVSLPCGSIVRFNKPTISSEPITAIVLDRGVTGTTLDLLVDSYDYAVKNVGTSRINYDILRFGWTREPL